MPYSFILRRIKHASSAADLRAILSLHNTVQPPVMISERGAKYHIVKGILYVKGAEYVCDGWPYGTHESLQYALQQFADTIYTCKQLVDSTRSTATRLGTTELKELQQTATFEAAVAISSLRQYGASPTIKIDYSCLSNECQDKINNHLRHGWKLTSHY